MLKKIQILYLFKTFNYFYPADKKNFGRFIQPYPTRVERWNKRLCTVTLEKLVQTCSKPFPRLTMCVVTLQGLGGEVLSSLHIQIYSWLALDVIGVQKIKYLSSVSIVTICAPKWPLLSFNSLGIEWKTRIKGHHAGYDNGNGCQRLIVIMLYWPRAVEVFPGQSTL